MSSAAFDLIARTVAEQLAARRCANCESLLASSRFSARFAAVDRIVVHVECPCGERLVLGVEPEAGAGVAWLR